MGKIVKRIDRVDIHIDLGELLHKRVILQGEDGPLTTTATLADVIRYHTWMLLHKHAPEIADQKFEMASVEALNGDIVVSYYQGRITRGREPDWVRYEKPVSSD